MSPARTGSATSNAGARPTASGGPNATTEHASSATRAIISEPTGCAIRREPAMTAISWGTTTCAIRSAAAGPTAQAIPSATTGSASPATQGTTSGATATAIPKVTAITATSWATTQ